ncbi:cell division protein FtsZ [Abyssibacter profundi]|uniref:Cell division protein FtsZ n=1 Tax=Abyssibacter profundi TaxID=2182787 RepID=A0A363UME7_9GAMM|nr:cell division protein FtsZ [Abyssibacter profundi]
MAEIFELIEHQPNRPVIKVMGIGGGGTNTVNQMVEAGIQGVEFICANTDVQHLDACSADTILQLGSTVTRGLGAGADPEVGRAAALEDRERIRETIEGSDMLFITAGMGGGTGTGAAPVVAEIARELEILTVAVVTKPFPFERKKRMDVAGRGIEALEDLVNSLIVIPNEKLLSVLGKSVTVKNAFKSANDVLHNAVQGIAELITAGGLINVDFADVRKVMSIPGMAMMGIGRSSGEDRAREAAETALASPLLDELTLTGAEGVLVNITAGDDLTMFEFQVVNEVIGEMAADSAEVIVGTALDPDMGDELRVTVVATGLGGNQKAQSFEDHEVVTPISRDGGGQVKYNDLEKPTYIRREKKARRLDDLSDLDIEVLDVPAFLRNQAD